MQNLVLGSIDNINFKFVFLHAQTLQ